MLHCTCVRFQLRRESEREWSEVHERLSEHNSIDTRETLSVPHPVLYTALKKQCDYKQKQTTILNTKTCKICVLNFPCWVLYSYATVNFMIKTGPALNGLYIEWHFAVIH